MDIYSLDGNKEGVKSLGLLLLLFVFFTLSVKLQSSLIGALLFLQYLVPFILVTIYEISLGKGSLITRYKQTSIGRTNNRYKNQIDDFWYILISSIGDLKGLSFILTIGLSNVHSSLNSRFETFYSQVFGGYFDGIVSILLVLILILILDLLDYAVHRIRHSVPLFWEYHECHHSAPQMTLLNTSRFVLIEQISDAPLIPIFAFTGLLASHYANIDGLLYPAYMLGIYNSAKTLNNLLSHTSSKIIYPKFISNILLSPSLHWIHHSTNKYHHDKNFGFLFIFWDKLFGTYLSEKHIKDIEAYGIENNEYNKHHPIFSATLLPIIKTFKLIRLSLKKKQLLNLFVRS